jgi:RHS repeat-associated protein
MQGAGGVGGLLWGRFYPSALNNLPTTNQLYGYDGNGNVTSLVNATTGQTSAQYTYGPFGELLTSTGPMAKTNCYRFSTKPQDDFSSLLYYGYRWYDPRTGRWITADPIGEAGGVNLYGYVGNDGIRRLDYLGRYPLQIDTSSSWFGNLTKDVQSDLLNNYGGRDIPVGPPMGKNLAADIASTLSWMQNMDRSDSNYAAAKQRLDDLSTCRDVEEVTLIDTHVDTGDWGQGYYDTTPGLAQYLFNRISLVITSTTGSNAVGLAADMGSAFSPDYSSITHYNIKIYLEEVTVFRICCGGESKTFVRAYQRITSERVSTSS